MQLPVFGPCFFAATGHVEHQLKQLHAHLFNRLGAVGNRACVDIHQVVPTACQIGTRSHFDDRHLCQTIGRATACGEHVQVHPRRQLQGATNEVTGRRGGVDQAFLLELFTWRQDTRNRCGTRFDNRAHGFFHDVGQAAFFVAGRGVGTAVRTATRQVRVIPSHLLDHGLGHCWGRGTRGQLVNAITHFGDF